MYNPYYPNYFNNQQTPQQNFLVVSSDDDIRKYPVAPGNMVTFRIENQPIIVEKSLGISQFDTPHYERYRMTKEEMPEKAPAPDYALKSDLDAIKQQFNQLNDKFTKLTEKKPRAKKEDKDESVE